MEQSHFVLLATRIQHLENGMGFLGRKRTSTMVKAVSKPSFNDQQFEPIQKI